MIVIFLPICTIVFVRFRYSPLEFTYALRLLARNLGSICILDERPSGRLIQRSAEGYVKVVLDMLLVVSTKDISFDGSTTGSITISVDGNVEGIVDGRSGGRIGMHVE